MQHDIVWRDGAATRARLAPRLERAAADGADLVVLAEMFATGYAPRADDVAEPVDGPSTEFLRERAASLRCWVAGSIAVTLPDGSHRNRFTAAGPNGELVTYDKRHLFTFADEHLQFAPGNDVVSFDVDGVRVTPFVCYDLRFADDFWRLGPDTDLFVVVANWPSPRRAHWSALLRARAIENQCYVVGVNRVGEADGLPHAGDSAVIDPAGEVAASAASVETTLVVDITAATVRGVRERFPVLQDRR